MTKERVNFRLDAELKVLLERIAKAEGRSATKQIEALITKEAKSKGWLPKSWTPKDETG